MIELRWVLLQKLRKYQYDYSDLSISISLSLSLEFSGACYDRYTPAQEVCDENGHPPLPSVSSDSAFHIGFISEWSSVGVVYSGCGRRITSL